MHAVTQTLTVAAIGLGLLGRIECRTYDALPNVELIAGADVAPEAREAFTAEFDRPVYDDYEELLTAHGDTLDAVNVVTPHTLHYEHAMACFEHDLHVFLEKPLTTDLEEARELVAVAAERDLILQVGYQRHFDPTFLEIRRLLTEGRIGDPHMATCYLGQEWISAHEGAWRTNPALSGGGQLYDSGSHLFDALLWVLEADPVTVSATIDNRGAAVDVNSVCSVTLDRDGDRVLASVGVSGDGTSGEPTEGLVIFGTDGHVSLLEGTLTVVERDGVAYEAAIDPITFEELTNRKLSAFLEAIRDGGPSPVPGSFGATVTALTEAAYEAAETGERVAVSTRTPPAETQ